MNDNDVASHDMEHYFNQEREAEKPSSHLLHRLGLKHPIFFHKTPFCKHDHGCIENTLVDAVNSFFYGYGIRTLIGLISFVLRQKNKTPLFKKLLKCLISKDNFKAGAFLGGYTLIMKGLLCYLREVRKKEDWKNSFAAGGIGGYLSVFFIGRRNRMTFATFFLSRAFDCYYNSLVRRGVIKKSQLNYVIIFLVLNLFTVYCRFHEPHILPSSISKFYEFVYSKNAMEGVLQHVLTELTKRRNINHDCIGH